MPAFNVAFSNQGGGLNAASGTIGAGSNIAAVVFVTHEDTTLTGVTCSQGGATVGTAITGTWLGGRPWALFPVVGLSAGACSFTPTASAGTQNTIVAIVLNNAVQTVGDLLTTLTQEGDAGSPSTLAGNTPDATDLLLSFLSTTSNLAPVTAGTGTLHATAGPSGYGHYSYGGTWARTGATTATDWTWASGSAYVVAVGVKEAVAGPTIDTQPSNATVILTNGSSASFTVAATGTGSLSYQWQRDTGSGFSDITGATSATLNVTDIEIGFNGYDYRCNVTDDNGTVASASANLAVYRGPRIATAFPATNGSGVSAGAIETDFPNALLAGSFIRIREASGTRTSRFGSTP